MSLQVNGVWKGGVWADTVWADGVWREGEPVETPDSGLAVIGIIQERGKGVLSTINPSGQSVEAIISPTFAVISTIQLRGKGVSGVINPEGQSVDGTI